VLCPIRVACGGVHWLLSTHDACNFVMTCGVSAVRLFLVQLQLRSECVGDERQTSEGVCSTAEDIGLCDDEVRSSLTTLTRLLFVSQSISSE
jgi:hypothetical protein